MVKLFAHNNSFASPDNGLMEQVKAYFTSEDWAFEYIDELNAIGLNFSGINGAWHCIAHIAEDDETFVFYSLLGEPISEDKRPTVAEFIARANFGLLLGNFELDFDDGELRYKTSVNTNTAPLTPQLLELLIYKNLTTMDFYLPGLHAVLQENISPSEAIVSLQMSGGSLL